MFTRLSNWIKKIFKKQKSQKKDEQYDELGY